MSTPIINRPGDSTGVDTVTRVERPREPNRPVIVLPLAPQAAKPVCLFPTKCGWPTCAC